MIDVKVVGDKEVIQRYKMVAKKLPDNLYKAMLRLTLYLAGYVKTRKLTGQSLKVRTGRLRNSITGKAQRIGNKIIGKVGTNVEYARIHEFGGDIYPKNAPYLRFQVNGQWVTTKHVKIPKRPYLQPSLKENRDRILRDLGAAVNATIR